jgi:uncharacterized protein YdhG (YjbR/CyaY superfamily)
MAVEDVDAYLDAQPPLVRETLQQLRRAIRAAAPDAVEVISYQVPTFRQGAALVAFGAGKEHCALYVMSKSVMDSLGADLAPYDCGRATIRFPAGEPLPDALVSKIVRARIEETARRGMRRSQTAT